MSLTILIPSNATTGSVTNINGGQIHWLCPTDVVTSNGAGGNTFFLESGSHVIAAGGGGSTFYVKTGATLDISGGGGSIKIFYETGAIINNTLFGGGSNIITLTNPIIFDYTNAPASPCLPDPNAVPIPESNCGCNGCNEDAELHNDDLITKAKTKFNTLESKTSCEPPFQDKCKKTALKKTTNLEPCFYLHWGDGSKDQIEKHDTEVLYITVCNNYNDINYKGLRITSINITPNTYSTGEIQLVPDRLINIDCLNACSCATREFSLLTRGVKAIGKYNIEVNYCFDEVVISSTNNKGKVSFPIEIVND